MLRKFGFTAHIGTDSRGRSGGTCLALTGNVICNVLDISSHLLQVLCTLGGNDLPSHMTCVYGPPKVEDRYLLWDFILETIESINGP